MTSEVQDGKWPCILPIHETPQENILMSKAILAILTAFLDGRLGLDQDVEQCLRFLQEQARMQVWSRDFDKILSTIDDLTELANEDGSEGVCFIALACDLLCGLLIPYHVSESEEDDVFKMGVGNAALALFLGDEADLMASMTHGVEDRELVDIIKWEIMLMTRSDNV